MNRFVALLVAITLNFIVPSSSVACSCWIDSEQVTSSVSYIVIGEVVGSPPACVPQAEVSGVILDKRIVRIDEAIKGEIKGFAEVHTGSTINLSNCSQRINSCGIYPSVGEKGVWALNKDQDGKLVFAGYCQTVAARLKYSGE